MIDLSNSRTKIIMSKKPFSRILLTVLVISGVILVASTNPYFGVKAIGVIQKELKRRKWSQFRDNLYYLKRKGFIDMEQNPDGSYMVKTTKMGREKAQKYNLDSLIIEVPKKWDKNWRLVIFDIPAKKYKARYALLEKLKELGFIMFQRSVWAHPFECKNEIVVVSKAFEVERYIHQITCHEISGREQLRGNFEKRNGIKLV